MLQSSISRTACARWLCGFAASSQSKTEQATGRGSWQSSLATARTFTMQAERATSRGSWQSSLHDAKLCELPVKAAGNPASQLQDWQYCQVPSRSCTRLREVALWLCGFVASSQSEAVRATGRGSWQ